MLSIVLYGRNDNYGYNLHKRAAISLNAMAAVLSDPDDEILFVDYNTDADLPTFPEAIRDTLTAAARKRLRIIRVRGHVQQAVRRNSRLQLNEPLARNIAIRRMCPKNSWVLSTNTDMVFVPRRGRTLSEVVAGLKEGYYALPRFEIPETLWESVDRKNPGSILRQFHSWGQRYLLNETVLIQKYQRYDGPGDFQLFQRQALARIHGFNEAMIHGWHVDANLSKRLYLLYGETLTLADQFYGYHCDHTRITTPAHGASRTENDRRPFFFDVASPDLPGQAESWGRPDDIFEEFTLSRGKSAYGKALDALLKDRRPQPKDVEYTERSYNSHVYYDTWHMAPYLVDALSALPSDTRIGYFGTNVALLQLLGDFVAAMGWSGAITYSGPVLRGTAAADSASRARGRFVEAASMAELGATDLHILDLHFPESTAVTNSHGYDVLGFSAQSLAGIIRHLRGFLDLVAAEQLALLMGQAPKKFILIGVQATVFEALIGRYIGLVAVPYACHIRHGFVRTDVGIIGAQRLFAFLDGLGTSALEGVCRHIANACGTSPGQLDFHTVCDRLETLVTAQRPGEAEGGAVDEPTVLAAIIFYAILGYFPDAAAWYGKYFQQYGLAPAK